MSNSKTSAWCPSSLIIYHILIVDEQKHTWADRAFRGGDIWRRVMEGDNDADRELSTDMA